MNSLLLVFAKAPVAGEVKRRLIPALGAAGAAALHERLVQRTLLAAAASGAATELWCAPDTGHPFFAACARRGPLRLRAQVGRDLGARMDHALGDALGRAGAAVLIGCDCALPQAAMLRAAFAALTHHDAVLGPTEDGGYWLLGLRTAQPRLFENIAWGSERVLQATRARLAECGARWLELPTCWDVDRPEDVARLRRVEAGRGAGAPDAVEGGLEATFALPRTDAA